MVQWVPSTAVALLFATTLLAGCMGGDASEDTTEQDRDPEWRVREVRVDSDLTKRCPFDPAGVDRWDCFAHEFAFKEFQCDPTQAVLVEKGLSRDEPWDGPGDRYVFCEYTLEWSLTVYSLFPDTNVYAQAYVDSQRVEDHCSTGRTGWCTLAGELEGTVELTRANSYWDLDARLEGSFAGVGSAVPSALPSVVNKGYLQATAELDIET